MTLRAANKRVRDDKTPDVVQRATGAPCIAIKVLSSRHRECAGASRVWRLKVQRTDGEMCASGAATVHLTLRITSFFHGNTKNFHFVFHKDTDRIID